MKKSILTSLAVAASLCCVLTSNAQVSLTADPVDYGSSPAMFTLDPEANSPASRGIAGTRQLRQTFQLSVPLDVEQIIFGVDLSGDDGGLVIDFYEVADVNASSWSAGTLIHTISLDTSVDLPDTTARLQIDLAGLDIFTLAQRDSGVEGYGMEFSNFDDSTNIGLIRHSNPGVEVFAGGRFYKEDNNPSGTGRDLGISLSGTIVPEPTTFTLLGLGSLALVMVRRRR